MFYFEGLLNQALAGIDATAILPAIIGIAYTILMVGFLISLYQAAMRGGDLQALAAAGAKYLIVAAILANWSAIFHEVNTSFNHVAEFIGSTSGAGDMFMSWMDQLKQDFPNHTGISLMDAVTGDYSSGITTLLIVISYVIYVLATIIFGFFYAFYGCLLYGLGPLVLALLPLGSAGDVAKSYGTNVMIWNAWSLIYAMLGALITAVHANHYDAILNGGFLGFLQGSVNSIVLGIVSVFYALMIVLIPFVAKRLISGDVGGTAMALVRTAAAIAGTVVAGGVGFAAGAAAAAGAGASSGAASGAASSASSKGSTAAGAGASSTSSSSTAPPQPNLPDSISKKLQKGEGGQSSRSGSGSGGTRGGEKSGHGGQSYRGDQSGAPYRPQGLAQTIAYHAGRMAGNVAANQSKGKDKDESGKKES